MADGGDDVPCLGDVPCLEKNEAVQLPQGLTMDGFRYQSLTMQLLHPKVRSDFLDGRLCDVSLIDPLAHSEEVLAGLDNMRQVIIPSWRAQRISMDLLSRDAVNCLTMLSLKSDTVFEMLGDQSMRWSYKNWAWLLEQIATNLYWLEVLPATISIKHLTVPAHIYEDPVKQSNPLTLEIQKSTSCLNDRIMKREQPDVASGETYRLEKSPLERKSRAPRNRAKEIDFICLSDSSSNSVGSEDSHSFEQRRSSRSHHARDRYIFPRREVVKPRPFIMNGWQSLRQYLHDYERYFYAKFEGNSRDCTQELSDFLPVELRDFFDTIGAHRLPYEDMKAELLSFYRTQKISGARHWREKLGEASMRPDESLKLYGLRLRDLGQKAYPHDDRECVREIRHRFLRTVPEEFAQQVQFTEGTSLVTGHEKKLPWATIMRLAEREDERTRKTTHGSSKSSLNPRDVWFNRPETQEVHQTCTTRRACCGGLQCPCFQGKALPEINSSEGSAGPRALVAPQGPDYLVDNMIASGDPRRSEKFRGRMSPRGRRTFVASPRNAQRQQQSFTPSIHAKRCQWCGRLGHSVDNCWEKQSVCMGCGSAEHTLDQCPRNLRQPPSNFRPICPICKGPHLGRDCTTPLN